MEDIKIIQGAVNALNEESIYEFTVRVVDVEPVIQPRRTLWDRITRKPLPTPIEPETHRTFKIYESVVSNVYRIAGKAVSLPIDIFEEEEKMLAYVPEHLPTMIYIIAAAIQNNHKEPDAELIRFLERNLTNSAVAKLLVSAMFNTNMQAFLISIVSMQAMASIVKPKTSPIDGNELIASHTAQ